MLSYSSRSCRPGDGRRHRAAVRLSALLLAAASFLDFGGGAALAQSPPPSRVVYAEAEVDKQPSPRKRIRIRWPAGVQKGDSITLRFIVTSDGRPEEVTVVRFTNPDMVGAAAEAYQEAGYSPAIKGGRKVDAWLTITETVK